jgi:hypothetical protein
MSERQPGKDLGGECLMYDWETPGDTRRISQSRAETEFYSTVEKFVRR